MLQRLQSKVMLRKMSASVAVIEHLGSSPDEDEKDLRDYVQCLPGTSCNSSLQWLMDRILTAHATSDLFDEHMMNSDISGAIGCVLTCLGKVRASLR